MDINWKEMPTKFVKIELDLNALNDFAKNVALTTARKIINEIHIPELPISEEDVCIKLKKTRQTIAKYRKDGKLRHHRLGKNVFYLQSELIQDLKNL